MEQANYSNMEVQERLFYKQSILPMLKQIENAFSNHPVMSADGQIKYRFDLSGIDVLKADEAAQADMGKILIESGQWTANEVRELWKKKPVADGNVLRAPHVVENPFSQLAFDVEAFKALPLPEKKNQKSPIEVNIPKAPIKSSRTKEVRDQLAKSYDDKLQAHDQKLAKEMRKIFSQQKEIVLSHVRSALKTCGTHYFKKGQEDELLKGVSEFTEAIVAIIRGSLSDVIKDFGPDTLQAIKGLLPPSYAGELHWDFADPRIERFIKQRSVAIGGLINQNMIADLRDEIAFLFEGGGDLRKVSEGVAAFFDMAEGYRSMRIARTETAAGAQEAIEATYQMNADVVVGKEWVSARDDRVRDSHQIDGQVVGLTDVFTLGSGETCEYPLAAGLPPEDAINCRCTTVPVLNFEGE
jgi:hypothetical protein